MTLLDIIENIGQMNISIFYTMKKIKGIDKDINLPYLQIVNCMGISWTNPDNISLILTTDREEFKQNLQNICPFCDDNIVNYIFDTHYEDDYTITNIYSKLNIICAYINTAIFKYLIIKAKFPYFAKRFICYLY